MKVAISCAFNENAIWALSRRASASGELTERLIPQWDLVADASGRFAHRKEARLAASSLPEDRVVSWLSEVLRIAGGRSRTPATPLLGHYGWKAQFDRRASRLLCSTDVDVLIGMPGSSRLTFARHGRPMKVFHAIDTHPRARNEALTETYGERAWGEVYPQRLVLRVEEELASADVVLVPSEVVRTAMVAHGVAAEKIDLVPYGVDLERFTVDPTVVRDPRSAPRPRLICVGQICLRKGVPLLLEAVRGLDVELSLAGQVFDRSIVRDLPDNVRFLGVLSPAELVQAYNVHDAMVLPTVDDACSLVVAEAAASGLRVVTTSANGAGELLPRSHRIIPPGDVGALRQALAGLDVLGLGQREDVARAIRNPGSSRIRSWASYAEDAEDVLRSRLDLHSTGPGRATS
jgi:glycosyltransferase involved in cell wall biosynthesis